MYFLAYSRMEVYNYRNVILLFITFNCQSEMDYSINIK
jgi:hypothetical protein